MRTRNPGAFIPPARLGLLSRRAASSFAPSRVPDLVHDVLRSPGQPLDATTRAFMEPRFGHDFSSVRVHTDAEAAESASAVNALAYTVGRDVVFGAGQYAPRTQTGQRLMAHELSHVIQQRSIGGSSRFAIGPEDDVHERAADRQAQRVVGGGQVENVTGPAIAPALQRQPPAPRAEETRKPAGEKVVVTQPPAQKIPAPQVEAAKKTDARKPPAAEAAKPTPEKKGIEKAMSLGVETETKTEEGETSTEVAGKYTLEVVIPITERLKIGKLSFFKEVGLEGSVKFPLNSVELQAALKVVSLDFEKVKVPFGLLDLGLSVSGQASGEYSLPKDKGAGKFGFAAEGEAKYKRREQSPFFIKLKVGVEETYDKEGNAAFKWSPAVWKTSAAVGVEF